jgi:hypothetical protein
MYTNNRNKKGQSLAELAAGLLVFVPIILLLIDCGVIMVGVSTNEAACRDAARAAAAGPPGLLSSGAHTVAAGQLPYKRAQRVIKGVYSAAGMIRINDTLLVKEDIKAPTPVAPAGGPVIGEVSVETTAEVMPPFLIRVFVENGTYQFKSTQRFPYTYILPAS